MNHVIAHRRHPIVGGRFDPIHPAHALRVKARPAHDLGGVGARSTVRDHEPGGARFERPRIAPVFAAPDPHHRLHAGGATGQPHGEDMLVTVIHMLHIDPDAVEIQQADQFDDLG
ncbi:MAG: hypothetical protein HC822_23540 [Oscillochloris sp.]|nr:hypothetical protein [Oscillochloris sp.]